MQFIRDWGQLLIGVLNTTTILLLLLLVFKLEENRRVYVAIQDTVLADFEHRIAFLEENRGK